MKFRRLFPFLPIALLVAFGSSRALAQDDLVGTALLVV